MFSIYAKCKLDSSVVWYLYVEPINNFRSNLSTELEVKNDQNLRQCQHFPSNTYSIGFELSDFALCNDQRISHVSNWCVEASTCVEEYC